jgi:hypothetical protein
MSNASSIIGYIGGTGRNQIPTVTVTTAVETNIPIVTDSGVNGVAILAIPQQTANVGSSTPLSPNANPAIIGAGAQAYGPIEGSQAPFFNSTSFDGRAFRIRLTGTATSAAIASQTLIFNLYIGTSKAGTKIFSTTAFTGVATAGTYSFIVEATLLWDSVSQNLNNFGLSSIGNTLVGTASGTQATAVTLANLQFNASFTTAQAASVAIAVREFTLDLV